MAKNLEMLNELSELKRTLAEFTETTDKRINDLLNEIDKSTKKTCDEELQEVINILEDFLLTQSCCENDASSELFELFLTLFDVYGLDKETIEGLYIDARENNDTKDCFDYAEIFKNDPTELNLIIFLERYCRAFDFNFIIILNSVVRYKKATSVISELISLGFKRDQFKKVYNRNRPERTCELCYYDLLMIKDVTEEQFDILDKKNPCVLILEKEYGTYLIPI